MCRGFPAAAKAVGGHDVVVHRGFGEGVHREVFIGGVYARRVLRIGACTDQHGSVMFAEAAGVGGRVFPVPDQPLVVGPEVGVGRGVGVCAHVCDG